MSVTLAELYQSTGIKLEIVRATQPLEAEDGDVIAKCYAGLHDQLLSEGLVTWAVTEEVPEWSKDILVDMMAAKLVDHFGVEEPRRSYVKLEGILGFSPVSPAERRLRRQLAAPYIPNVIQTEQF